VSLPGNRTITTNGTGTLTLGTLDDGGSGVTLTKLGTGTLSFPMPGISIALDIPYDGVTQALVDQMNRLVIEEGGRVYLAKDALTRAADFRAMEPRLERFLDVRRKWDPNGRIRSAQSVRLFGW